MCVTLCLSLVLKALTCNLGNSKMFYIYRFSVQFNLKWYLMKMSLSEFNFSQV